MKTMEQVQVIRKGAGRKPQATNIVTIGLAAATCNCPHAEPSRRALATPRLCPTAPGLSLD